MAWSGFGQTHLVQKQAGVQESPGPVSGKMRPAHYQFPTLRLIWILNHTVQNQPGSDFVLAYCVRFWAKWIWSISKPMWKNRWVCFWASLDLACLLCIYVSCSLKVKVLYTLLRGASSFTVLHRWIPCFQNIFRLRVALSLWLASIGGNWHAVLVSQSDDVQYQNPEVIVNEDVSVCCSKTMEEFC